MLFVLPYSFSISGVVFAGFVRPLVADAAVRTTLRVDHAGPVRCAGALPSVRCRSGSSATNAWRTERVPWWWPPGNGHAGDRSEGKQANELLSWVSKRLPTSAALLYAG